VLLFHKRRSCWSTVSALVFCNLLDLRFVAPDLSYATTAVFFRPYLKSALRIFSLKLFRTFVGDCVPDGFAACTVVLVQQCCLCFLLFVAGPVQHGLGTGCRPNWKRQPVPLTVSNALWKHFYFSLPTAVKHVLADSCKVPSVRL